MHAGCKGRMPGGGGGWGEGGYPRGGGAAGREGPATPHVSVAARTWPRTVV